MSDRGVTSEQTPLIGAANGSSEISTWRLVILLSALYSGVVLAAMDTTIVTTLMGHIASELRQLDNISWIATGYTVAYSAFQPLYGKFSDIFGRKHVSVFCTIMFGIGCLMCGVAAGLPALIAGRFVSGVGAGGMLSMSTVTVSDYIPLRKRGIFQGIGNVCFGSGAALGGIFGGWVTSISGWRMAFKAQVPLALICAIAVWLAVIEKKAGDSEIVTGDSHVDHPVKRNSLERIDIVGSFALVSALLFFMLGTTTGGNQFAWFSLPIASFFILSGGMLYVFYYWELCKAIEPVMPLEVICHRTVMSACLANFFGSALAYSFLYYGPLFLQAVYGYDYTNVSHCILINFVGVASGSLGSGLYMRHTGRYWKAGILASFAMLCSSSMFSVGTALWFPLTTKTWYQWLAFLLQGVGYASMLTITLIALIAAVSPELQATTTAAQYTFRGAGSSIGISASAAILQNVLASALRKNLPHNGETESIIHDLMKSVEAIKDVPKKYLSAITASYRTVEIAVFAFVSTMAIACIVASTFQDEHRLERDSAREEYIEDLVEETLVDPASEV